MRVGHYLSGPEFGPRRSQLVRSGLDCPQTKKIQMRRLFIRLQLTRQQFPNSLVGTGSRKESRLHDQLATVYTKLDMPALSVRFHLETIPASTSRGVCGRLKSRGNP